MCNRWILHENDTKKIVCRSPDWNDTADNFIIKDTMLHFESIAFVDASDFGPGSTFIEIKK